VGELQITVTDYYDKHFDRELAPQEQEIIKTRTSQPTRRLEEDGWEKCKIRPSCHMRGYNVQAARAPVAHRWLEAYGLFCALYCCVADTNGNYRGAYELISCAAIKPRLRSTYQDLQEQQHSGEGRSQFQSRAEASFFALCDRYFDVVHASHPYPTVAAEISPEESAALLHVTNHLLKKMDAVRKNNERIASGSLENTAARDQGFVRPIALLLVPMRSLALPLIQRLAALAQRENRYVLVVTLPGGACHASAVCTSLLEPPPPHTCLYCTLASTACLRHARTGQTLGSEEKQIGTADLLITNI
jgi:Utp25, U3 small nucleolar RNA-associated SSU processome protein 25